MYNEKNDVEKVINKGETEEELFNMIYGTNKYI